MGGLRKKMDPYEKSSKSKICTINLMKTDVKFIDYLVEQGYFLSRSAAVRIALHKFVDEFIEFHEKIKKFKPIKKPMELIELSPNGWKILGPTHTVKK